MITRRFLLALLATVALLGAACSSSGDETATADDAGSDSSESTTEDDTSTGDEPAETTSTTSTTTTTTSTTTTATTTTTTVPAIDPFFVDSYCTFSVNFDARAEQVNIFDPDEVRMWLLGTQGEIQRFVDVAPAEIRDDIALQAESFDEFVAIIEANDWNLLDSAEEVDALETPEADAAADRLDDWEDEVCADGDYEIAGGIGDGTDEPDAPPSFEEALASPEAIAALLETDIGRQLFIEGMTEDGSVTVEEAECFLDNLDPACSPVWRRSDRATPPTSTPSWWWRCSTSSSSAAWSSEPRRLAPVPRRVWDRRVAYTVFRLNHVHPDPSDGSEMSDRYRAALDMVEFLDQRGLNAVQFDEHHVSSTGWSPTPMMNAGMVLSRTENVLCMIGALLLPLHDPLRVAEDLAVLDLVGKGRIVVTMGLGYRPLEYTAMGKEWTRRGKIMDESLDVLLQAWTGEPFEHHGEMVQVLPKPFTSPHPQIMIGGSAKASARRAARLGLPLYMNGNPPGIKELYEELCAENGTVPFCIAPEEAPQLFITDDPERAWAELGEHFMLEARTYADWQPEGQNSPVHSHAMTLDELRAEGIYRFLTPDEAREFVAGAGSCTLHPLVGGMPIDEAWRSVELFAETVLGGDS